MKICDSVSTDAEIFSIKMLFNWDNAKEAHRISTFAVEVVSPKHTIS